MSPTPHVVAHADWSADPAKRWVAVAVRADRGWLLRAVRRLGTVGSIAERIGADADQGPLLLGVDFAVGVPAGWARSVGVTDFSSFLRAAVAGEGPWQRVLEPALTAEEIGPHRPFYPGGVARAGDAARLVSALGGRRTDDLRRRCERTGPVAAQPLFLTMGQRQVGKGSIAGWRELLVPAELGGADERAPGLWPFDGTLAECLAAHPVTVAECYPARATAAIAPGMGSKRDPAARAAAAAAVLAAASAVGLAVPEALGAAARAGLPAGSLPGLTRDGAGEDPFDALVGLIDMLRVLAAGPEPLPADEEVRHIEGWILGTPVDAPAAAAPADRDPALPAAIEVVDLAAEAEHDPRRARGLAALRAVHGTAGEEILRPMGDLARQVVDHAYGDIYARPGLGLRDRQLVTIAMLVVLGHEGQLATHIRAGLRVGLEAGEIEEVVLQAIAYAGYPVAMNALTVLRGVLEE